MVSGTDRLGVGFRCVMGRECSHYVYSGSSLAPCLLDTAAGKPTEGDGAWVGRAWLWHPQRL